MKGSQWLTLVGGLLLLAGLVTALISTHYEARVMGKAAMGVAVLAPDKGGPEWRKKEALRSKADWWFWIGIALTAVGVVLQTLGAILPQT